MTVANIFENFLCARHYVKALYSYTFLQPTSIYALDLCTPLAS